ncbi:MAG: TetR/AcrR family transcriptional regulator [Polyangiaceae bacterium]
MRPRDPEKTKARILAAATNEFAAKGFAGARVDTIARRAKSNKRMLYHYFGDKKALFEATVGKLLSDQQQLFAGAPTELEDKIAFHFNAAPQKAKWLRLLLWESLAYGERPVMAERVRCNAMAKSCEQMRAAQAQGNMLPDMPAEHVMLALMAMSVFPWAFPQVTRMLTGTAPSDRSFQTQYTRLLREVTRRLKRAEKSRAKNRAARTLELS